MNLTSLNNAPRLLLEADLRPVAGRRFQPTGFADLGAAEYKLPDGTPMLLVESAQSVANRLEKTCLDGDGPGLDLALEGLPYVVAELEGADGVNTTSSLVEAHRIGSPYFLLNKEFQATLVKEMGYNSKQPLDWKKIYATLFKYDANSLVHGVFLSLLEGGRVRAPRAITGFIEAENVERVVSGGVKNSPVDPTGKTQVARREGERERRLQQCPLCSRGVRSREDHRVFQPRSGADPRLSPRRRCGESAHDRTAESPPVPRYQPSPPHRV